jgi:hypothetical protein
MYVSHSLVSRMVFIMGFGVKTPLLDSITGNRPDVKRSGLAKSLLEATPFANHGYGLTGNEIRHRDRTRIRIIVPLKTLRPP